jgi:hypothetical protein
MVQTRQLNEDNNASATTVTTPMQSEDKEVSKIMMMMPVQQGQQSLCNVGNGASATRAMTPL